MAYQNLTHFLNKILSALAYSLLILSFYLEICVGINRLFVILFMDRKNVGKMFDEQLTRKLGWFALLLTFGLCAMFFVPKIEMVLLLEDYTLHTKVDESALAATIISILAGLLIITGMLSLLMLYLAIGAATKLKVSVESCKIRHNCKVNFPGKPGCASWSLDHAEQSPRKEDLVSIVCFSC